MPTENLYHSLYQFFFRDRYNPIATPLPPEMLELDFYYYEVEGASGRMVPYMLSSYDIQQMTSANNIPVIMADNEQGQNLTNLGFFVVGVFFDTKEQVLPFVNGDENRVKTLTLEAALKACTASGGDAGMMLIPSSKASVPVVHTPERTQEYTVVSISDLASAAQYTYPEVGGDTFTDDQKKQITKLLTTEPHSLWVMGYEFGVLPRRDGTKVDCLLFEAHPELERHAIDVLADRLWREILKIKDPVMLAEVQFPERPFRSAGTGR